MGVLQVVLSARFANSSAAAGALHYNAPMRAELLYLFRHALLRDAAYQLQPPEARGLLHEHALRAMEHVADGRHAMLDQFAAELAVHAREARHNAIEPRTDLTRVELAYLQRAADRARDDYRHADAARHYGAIAAHPASGQLQAHNARLEHGRVLRYSGSPEAAARVLTEAAAMAREAGLLREAGEALGSLGSVLAMIGRVDAAFQVQQEATACASELGDPVAISSALANHAGLCLLTGRREEALELMRQSLAGHAAHTPQDILKRRATMALCLLELGRTSEAEPMLLEALEAYEHLGNLRAVAEMLSHLAHLHDQTGRGIQAEALIRRSLELKRKLGDRYGEGIVLSALGGIQSRLGRSAEAAATIRAALHLHRETGNRRSEGIAMSNLATVLNDMGETAQSLQLLEAALAIHRQVRNRVSEGVALGNIAAQHFAAGRLEESCATYAQAMDIHRETGSTRNQATTGGDYAVCLLALGRRDEAAALWAESITRLVALKDEVSLRTRMALMSETCRRLGLPELESPTV